MPWKEPVKWETKGWREKESEKSRLEYSRTSRKQPPKISSFGGCLKGLLHASAHVQHLDFMSDEPFSKKKISFHRPVSVREHR